MKIQTPASHANDPETSFMAEAEMNKGKRFRNQDILAAAVMMHEGMTAAELGEYTGLGQHEASRRLSELNGITVRHGPRRKCTVKGTNMITWHPMETKGKYRVNWLVRASIDSREMEKLASEKPEVCVTGYEVLTEFLRILPLIPLVGPKMEKKLRDTIKELARNLSCRQK